MSKHYYSNVMMPNVCGIVTGDIATTFMCLAQGVILMKREGLTMTKKKEYYSVAEAAAYLGCNASWVYQLISAKKLPFDKVGSFHMVPADPLRKYKRNQKKGVANATT